MQQILFEMTSGTITARKIVRSSLKKDLNVRKNYIRTSNILY